MTKQDMGQEGHPPELRMIRTFLLFLIRAYQAFLSPLAPAVCKFHPTCSRYACEAIERHGAARGSVLALRRLLRCQPWCRGGFDPVPPCEARERETCAG